MILCTVCGGWGVTLFGTRRLLLFGSTPLLLVVPSFKTTRSSEFFAESEYRKTYGNYGHVCVLFRVTCDPHNNGYFSFVCVLCVSSGSV